MESAFYIAYESFIDILQRERELCTEDLLFRVKYASKAN